MVGGTEHGGAGRAWLAVMLTWLGGYVDAVGYVALYRVFVANMSGNSLAIGIGIVRGHVDHALHRGFAIPVFVVGLLVSRLVIHLAMRRGWRHAAAVTFGLGGLLLGAFALAAEGHLAPGGRLVGVSTAGDLTLVALPAMAMGLQNATLTHFGPLTVRTTHVTGSLVKMSDHLADWIVWSGARLRGRLFEGRRWRRVARVSRRSRDLRLAGLLLAVWGAYALGAFLGALAFTGWHLTALGVPIALYAGLVVLDLVRPLQPAGEEGP